MSWFTNLTGFTEKTPNQVRQNMHVDGDMLISDVNGKMMSCGRLAVPSLAELRERVSVINGNRGGKLTLREVIADIQTLHADKSNAGALFQVASQFNLLEMISPNVTPEDGVGTYEHDRTQGPACAIACGAGTVYRNYFASVNGRIGQSKGNQIDCLADLGRILDNTGDRLWKMQNGYALATRDGLAYISKRIKASNENELDEMRQAIRIGVQWNTQVTIRESNHLVSQAYCSALPVAYSKHPKELWEDFARLVLEAAYEATMCVAILNCKSTGVNKVFFTLLGGGAFGNDTRWITQSIDKVLRRYMQWDIDAAIVSYGSSKPHVRQLVEGFV